MVLKFPAHCTKENVGGLWRRTIRDVEALSKGSDLLLDADDTTDCDGAGEALILEVLRIANRRELNVEIKDARGVIAGVRKVYPEKRFAQSAKRSTKKAGMLEALGEGAVTIFDAARTQLAFLGECSVAFCRTIFAGGKLRWRDLWLHFERAGADALPITLLVGFLLGLILAFMSATALQQFGVEIYVADLLSIGLFRELGPIMTAIVLAGRSGSAFAAELGTMKVDEEVDALTTLGLSPVEFLALPRVLAAACAMPLLSIFACIAGIVGGSLVLLPMGIPLVAYCQHIASATSVTNVLFGLGKAVVFGLLAGMSGCSRGLDAGRAADSVGTAATKAVVGSLVLVVAFDGAFAVLAFFAGV